MFSLTPDEWTAVELSLRIAVVATVVSLPFGIAIAWLLARKQFWGKGLLDTLVHRTAPSLLDVYGVGTHTAAILLVAAGDNPHRLKNEAAFAHLCGVAPMRASSGKVDRHRLNPGGNRQANHALWRIVFTRMSGDERTRKYVARRVAEGRSTREVMRVLKRYVARELYPHLVRG